MLMNLGTRFRFFNINIHIHNTENPVAAVVAKHPRYIVYWSRNVLASTENDTGAYPTARPPTAQYHRSILCPDFNHHAESIMMSVVVDHAPNRHRREGGGDTC
jgi:hypothetical protein